MRRNPLGPKDSLHSLVLVAWKRDAIWEYGWRELVETGVYFVFEILEAT